ncbi:MAG: Ig-like domain-containing protein, partial [Dethiobacteria bacterium]
SDESVATVNEDGLVTAVGPGRALVTVTTEDGHFTAGCTITVTAAPGSDSGLEADTSKLKNELPRTSTSPALFISLGAVLTAGGLVLLRKKR